MGKDWFIGVTLTIALVASAQMASAGDCVSVYQNATRNVEIVRRQQTELNYLFNQYCYKDGSVNNSSFSVGIDAVVKQIPFKFSLGSTDNQSKMQEFCKTGVQQNFFQATQYDTSDTVVVDALSNFNECLRLENKGLRITHQEQAPRSVLIFGELTNNFTAANLDIVEYDKDCVSCSTPDFSANKSSIKVGPNDPSRPITKNFTISCVRTAVKDKDGSYFPPVKIGLSTSLGPYTASLVEDTLNGFMLASQAKANFDRAVAQRNDEIG